MGQPFVPDGFEVPLSFDGPGFRLEPLGPEHNEHFNTTGVVFYEYK